MRILQINSAKNFGGGEKHFVDLTHGLVRLGHSLFIAVSPDSPILDKLPEINDENVLQIRMKNAIDLFAARSIRNFVNENEIDVIHAHSGKDYLIAGIAARFAPTAKFVLTRHVLFPLKGVQKYLLNNLSKVIAVSSAVEASLQKTFPREKIVTVPNGIDVENWSNVDREKLREEFRFENNISFDSIVIGTVGELKHLKGQQDFILAAQLIVKEFPDTHFVIVGKDHSNDRSFRRELKRLVKTFDLEKNFSWFDWIEDTKPLFSSLDIFVSPSHSESFGLAILEAMSAGCAVVSTETEGAKEIIEINKSGVLTEIKDPVRLAETICELISDREKRTELGLNARKRVEDSFGLERMISETDAVYKQIWEDGISGTKSSVQ